MALQRVAGNHSTGEDASDLQTWLSRLDGCPSISATAGISCQNPVHSPEPATWFYVEADAQTSTARRRCLGCGEARYLLDSEQHWTPTPMWCCALCGQSIVELAAGLHLTDEDLVTWLALGARCVGCGNLSGLTDLWVPNIPRAVVENAL